MSTLRTLSTGAPPSLSGNVDGSIYGVNGIDTPFVVDPKNGIRNWGIAAPPAAPTAASVGAGVVDGTVLYRVTWENQNAGIYGLYSATLSFAASTDTVRVTQPSIAGIDSQVTHWIVWRTLAGATDTFHKVASVAIGTSTYDDNTADDALGTETLEEHSPPDPMFRYVKEYKGLLFLYGSRVESTGTVSINTGTAAVTGVGTQFNQSHVGEKMWFTGDTTVYTILSVTDATHLTLTSNKSGTVAGVVYKITAERPSDMTAQRADDESFEAAERWGVFPADGDFPTGLILVGNTLCPCKGRHIYGYEFGDDPNPTASAIVYPILQGRGLINEWCSVGHGATAYNLDRSGIYAFDGSGQAEPIDQAIRRFFHPDQGVPTDDRINWAYADTWRAVYDPVMHAAKWAVTTGTDTSPKTILCFDLERQKWTVDRDPAGIRAFALENDSSGVFRAWKTDNLAAPGSPWALGGTRQLDGTIVGTVAGNATASGNTSLTDGGAAFTVAGSGLAGVTVAALTSPPQLRVISSNTGTVLTISQAWDSNPAVGTAYIVGAVETRWRSQWHVFDPQARAIAQVLTLYFEPTSADIVFYVRLFKDFGTSPILTWSPAVEKDGVVVPYTARTDGWLKIHANEAGGRAVIVMPENAIRAFSVEIMQLNGNNPVIITGYDLDGDPQGKSNRAE